jgi:hypothetical protein
MFSSMTSPHRDQPQPLNGWGDFSKSKINGMELAAFEPAQR